ncbi:hypothetical protein A9W96_27365 [Mycobacterium sp. 1245852.3]|nr:hypothetical protein A9W96_27365 [Mycobacterium sp. 1245852.3]
MHEWAGADSNGARLPGILMLPGLFGGEWVWHEVAVALAAEGFEVVALDEPLGLKPNVSHPDQLVAMVRLLIEEHFGRPVVLAGNSFGGLVALELAATFPSLLTGLVLSGSPGLEQKTPAVPARVIVQPRLISKAFGTEQASKMFYNENFITPELVEKVYGPFADISNRQKLAIIRALRIADSYEAARRFAQISTPTLLLWGLQDTLTPAVEWERSAQHFPDAQFVGIPEAGHSPMAEQPELVASALTTFMARLDAPGAVMSKKEEVS